MVCDRIKKRKYEICMLGLYIKEECNYVKLHMTSTSNIVFRNRENAVHLLTCVV